MKTILSLLLICLSSFAFSSVSVPVKDMTPGQRADLQKELDDANKPAAEKFREEATQWASFGANIGQAMLGAAKEIGMAAGEFAQTPLGKVVVSIVVFKILGTAFLHICAAALLLTIGLTFFWYIHRRILQLPKYEAKPVLWGLWQRKVLIGYENNDNGNRDSWNIVSVVALILTIIPSVILIATAGM